MDVRIDSEAVQAAVAQAIIDSSIGKLLRERIETFLRDYKFSSALDDALRHAVREEVLRLLASDETLRTKTRELMLEKMTEGFASAMITKLFENAMKERY